MDVTFSKDELFFLPSLTPQEEATLSEDYGWFDVPVGPNNECVEDEPVSLNNGHVEDVFAGPNHGHGRAKIQNKGVHNDCLDGHVHVEPCGPVNDGVTEMVVGRPDDNKTAADGPSDATSPRRRPFSAELSPAGSTGPYGPLVTTICPNVVAICLNGLAAACPSVIPRDNRSHTPPVPTHDPPDNLEVSTHSEIIKPPYMLPLRQNRGKPPDRYNVRLVAKGYTQTFGVDYQETFAPVAKMNTIRVLLSLTANFDWPLRQFDIKNAFLHGDLEEEVYKDFPLGYGITNSSGKVCRLRKALYGLKQSPRAWFGRFTQAMKKCRYRQGNSDHTLFIKHKDGKVTLLIIYVDDMIVTGDDTKEIERI
nr:uncharacterized protein LOC103412466 [Malus domestica]